VRREGHVLSIPAGEVVEGDLLLLEAGDVVAADARLVEAHALETIESALTGESLPVEKQTEPAPAGAPLAERADCVFLGTAVASGRGAAVVEGTGMSSEGQHDDVRSSRVTRQLVRKPPARFHPISKDFDHGGHSRGVAACKHGAAVEGQCAAGRAVAVRSGVDAIPARSRAGARSAR
jgi:hypothetical protein